MFREMGKEQTMAKPRIISDPNIMVGKPVIAGTRITVECILEQLAGGRTVEQIMDNYELSREEIQAALEYAIAAVAHATPQSTDILLPGCSWLDSLLRHQRMKQRQLPPSSTNTAISSSTPSQL
jgi:uncharacterized protein (DUF433 family)